MTPENTNPAAKTDTSAGEFDFIAHGTETPRMKRRSLKAKSPAITPVENNPVAASRPEATVDPQTPSTGYSRPAGSYESYRSPSPSAPSPPAASPAGTLYYRNATPQEPEPMKSTPLASPASPSARPVTAAAAPVRPASSASPSPASSHSAPASSSASRPASSFSSAAARPAPASSPARALSAAPARTAGVADYRGNIERQSREQKSIGGLLNIIVYSLIGLFVIGAMLAGYGAFVFSKQLRQQSVTMSDLDSRYAAQNQTLTAELKTTQEALIQVQAQGGRQQELLLHQQEAIGKLLAAGQETTNELREEKNARAAETATRASETAYLRSRIRTLEARSQQIYRP